jgi:hypothetical protein
VDIDSSHERARRKNEETLEAKRQKRAREFAKGLKRLSDFNHAEVREDPADLQKGFLSHAHSDLGAILAEAAQEEAAARAAAKAAGRNFLADLANDE